MCVYIYIIYTLNETTDPNLNLRVWGFWSLKRGNIPIQGLTEYFSRYSPSLKDFGRSLEGCGLCLVTQRILS